MSNIRTLRERLGTPAPPRRGIHSALGPDLQPLLGSDPLGSWLPVRHADVWAHPGPPHPPRFCTTLRGEAVSVTAWLPHLSSLLCLAPPAAGSGLWISRLAPSSAGTGPYLPKAPALDTTRHGRSRLSQAEVGSAADVLFPGAPASNPGRVSSPSWPQRALRLLPTPCGPGPGPSPPAAAHRT